MKNQMKFYFSALISVTLIISSTSYATPNLFFRGIIIDPPPCLINNEKQIDIDFGDKLGINKIDGNNYRQKINYTIECYSDPSAAMLLLTVTGKVMSGDKSAIQSSKPGLGIRLLENNRHIHIGQGWVINTSTPPLLEAVPVADAKIQLVEGDFVASASLMAEYY